MNENFNIDFVLFMLNDIVDSTRRCISNFSIDYSINYKDNLYSLINILDSAEFIEKEINNYFKKELD